MCNILFACIYNGFHVFDFHVLTNWVCISDMATGRRTCHIMLCRYHRCTNCNIRYDILEYRCYTICIVCIIMIVYIILQIISTDVIGRWMSECIVSTISVVYLNARRCICTLTDVVFPCIFNIYCIFIGCIVKKSFWV